MNALLAIGAVNAGFLGLLVLRKRSCIVADRVLGALLLLLGLAYLLVFAAREWAQDGWLLLLVYSNLLLGPLLYLYVVCMVAPDGRLPRFWRGYFVPFAIAMVYLTWTVLTLSDAELARAFGERNVMTRTWAHNLFYFLDLAAMPLCLLGAWQRLQGHARRIADRYSYRDSIDYAWLRHLLVLLGVLWVIIDLPLLAALFAEAPSDETILGLGFSVGTLLILYTGYFGFRQTAVYVDAAVEPQSTMGARARYERSGMDEDELGQYRERLLEYMRVGRPYLDRTLALRDLAGPVGLSEHNLSEVINSAVGKSFYEFVNAYRIEEFKRSATLEEVRRRTLLEIALDCGFNSKSSFNRIFKQQTGVTPSVYLERQFSGGSGD